MHSKKTKQNKNNKKTINQNKMTTYGLGENICKRCDQPELNFQNIQTIHITQLKKKTKKQITQSKMARRPK